MAYTIVKSDGTVLTTIADGTINTTSTSQGLPGRNYAGYGQTLDTNIVHQLENFADVNPPDNPIRGQLWYNTNTQVLLVCPTDGETNPANWFALTSTASGGTTTFGQVTVTGNLQANNITATNNVTGANGIFTNISVSANANIAVGNITSAILGTANTTSITSGSNTTAGSLTGTWTANGGASGNSFVITNGNLFIANTASAGIKSDFYYYSNGSPISFAGTYSNANVAAYLPTYNGNVLATTLQGITLTTGANTTAGTVTGNWTLSTGSRLNATYADLAERFEADAIMMLEQLLKWAGKKKLLRFNMNYQKMCLVLYQIQRLT
jgi:hypothetical protein